MYVNAYLLGSAGYPNNLLSLLEFRYSGDGHNNKFPFLNEIMSLQYRELICNGNSVIKGS